uniref:Clc-like protein 5 n=1 Tax=Ascaris suum TaxID=6253 RepID=F1L6K5_ASCSU
MLFSLNNRLLKAQVTAVALICLSNLIVFIALLTPAWQVAKDTDAGVYVQSGLWLYCPGSVQCWYIFSDDVVNYYERVDVCRFFLIGDCRKKLLRTPYFFGWHYAVLIIIIFALIFGVTATAALGVSIFKKNKARILTIVFNGFAFLSFLFLAIALAVFVINAEMLESRYLIGIKNTFRKEYGYSFYLAALAMLLLLFALLAGVMVATFVFFSKGAHDHSAVPGTEEDDLWQRNQLYALRKIKEAELQSSLMSSSTAIPVFEQQVFEQPPRPGSIGGSHSDTPLPPPDVLHSRGGCPNY